MVAAVGASRLLQDSKVGTLTGGLGGAQSGGFPTEYRILARAKAARTMGRKLPGGEKNKLRA